MCCNILKGKEVVVVVVELVMLEDVIVLIDYNVFELFFFFSLVLEFFFV